MMEKLKKLTDTQVVCLIKRITFILTMRRGRSSFRILIYFYNYISMLSIFANLRLIIDFHK